MPDAIDKQILERVGALRPGTTMCPGALAKELGHRLADLRPALVALAHAGRLGIRQGGRRADPDTLRGPFRVGLP